MEEAIDLEREALAEEKDGQEEELPEEVGGVMAKQSSIVSKSSIEERKSPDVKGKVKDNNNLP